MNSASAPDVSMIFTGRCGNGFGRRVFDEVVSVVDLVEHAPGTRTGALPAGPAGVILEDLGVADVAPQRIHAPVPGLVGHLDIDAPRAAALVRNRHGLGRDRESTPATNVPIVTIRGTFEAIRVPVCARRAKYPAMSSCSRGRTTDASWMRSGRTFVA